MAVPIRSFRGAKGRLAPVLDDATRADLARSMAITVVQAAHDLDVVIVTTSQEVAEWATSVGATAIGQTADGLDGAAVAAVSHAAAAGYGNAAVVHADLPLARDLRPALGLAGPDRVVLVGDRHHDGTNVIALPADALDRGFRFSYGAESLDRHIASAQACGLAVHLHADDRLAWDVDLPEDLALPQRLAPASLRFPWRAA